MAVSSAYEAYTRPWGGRGGLWGGKGQPSLQHTARRRQRMRELGLIGPEPPTPMEQAAIGENQRAQEEEYAVAAEERDAGRESETAQAQRDFDAEQNRLKLESQERIARARRPAEKPGEPKRVTQPSPLSIPGLPDLPGQPLPAQLPGAGQFPVPTQRPTTRRLLTLDEPPERPPLLEAPTPAMLKREAAQEKADVKRASEEEKRGLKRLLDTQYALLDKMDRDGVPQGDPRRLAAREQIRKFGGKVRAFKETSPLPSKAGAAAFVKNFTERTGALPEGLNAKNVAFFANLPQDVYDEAVKGMSATQKRKLDLARDFADLDK